jgi:ribonuclease HI
MCDITHLEGYVDSSFQNKHSVSVFKFKEIDTYFVVKINMVDSSTEAEFVGIVAACNYVLSKYPLIKSFNITTDSQSAKNTFFPMTMENFGIRTKIPDAKNLKDLFKNLNIDFNVFFQYRNTCEELANCDHIARSFIQGRGDVSFVNFSKMETLKTEIINP